MSNLTMTVNEFLAIMGTLDERLEASGFKDESAIYDAWYQQWRDLEAKVESLGMMERADMLFDGKVTINDISDEHLTEAISAVAGQVAMHQKMIDENDVDADPEDLEIWQNRLETMKTL